MNRRIIKELLAAWGIAFVLSSAASFLGIYLSKRFPSSNALPLFLVVCGAFLLACIVNRMSAKTFARQHFGKPLAERREIMKQHVERCKADPKAVLDEYKGLEIVPIFILVVYCLLSASITAAGSFCLSIQPQFLGFSIALISWFMGCFLLYMPFYRLFGKIPHKIKQSVLLPVGKMPRLEALIRRAADTVGVQAKFRIRPSKKHLARVVPRGKTYIIHLSLPFLSTLTEEEVYQLLLTLFDHFAQLPTYKSNSRAWHLSNLGSAHIRRETFAFDLFFSHIDATMEWDMVFDYTAYRFLREWNSLRRIQEVGNPDAAISMISKQAMWRHFMFEANRFLTKPAYLDPTPVNLYERNLCEAFRAALQIRYDAWLDMLMQEIHPQSERYAPLFHEYHQRLTPQTRPTLHLPALDESTDFGKELIDAITWYDKQEYWKFAPFYEDNRRREYLEPLAITEAYEKNPDGYTTPELSPVINAYRDICAYDKAEAICDGILETETNQFALAHATFFKGVCMLHRYETEGIDLIYRAIDLNKNYMQDGFAIVEEYCTLCGLEDEYKAFLYRADIQMSAHAYNHENAGNLSPRDHLVKEEALGDMLPDILAYMEKAANGCIREIYLVRKVISDDFFTSAFVIKFVSGTSDETMYHTYQAIFNYLDAYPVDWQFSLFVYDPNTEAAVKRVDGSLVWEKK